jgi:hypothetical protein
MMIAADNLRMKVIRVEWRKYCRHIRFEMGWVLIWGNNEILQELVDF